MSEWLTTEQVVERLDTTAQVIYETRRRNEYPGKLGHRRGRRLMFDSEQLQDWLETVPAIERDAEGTVVGWSTDPAYGADETTNEAATAILWALEGIHTTLRAIHNELRAQRPQFFPVELTEVKVFCSHGVEGPLDIWVKDEAHPVGGTFQPCEETIETTVEIEGDEEE